MKCKSPRVGNQVLMIKGINVLKAKMCHCFWLGLISSLKTAPHMFYVRFVNKYCTMLIPSNSYSYIMNY